jgi:hypothetical protein
VFALDVQNEGFYLKGKLVGIAIGAATAVGQALNATVLIAFKDFIAAPLAKRADQLARGEH